ncbi:hypothetical protein DMENIID0001_040900 [Sergentomyia squamirostris]
MTPRKPPNPKSYTQADIVKAVEAYRSGKTLSQAARAFKIPKGTLHNKLTGRYPINCRVGQPTTLSEKMEAKLVTRILICADSGEPRTKEQVLDTVEELIRRFKVPNKFTNGRPGNAWFNSFLSRHRELKYYGYQGNIVQRAPIAKQDNIPPPSMASSDQETEPPTVEGNKIFVIDPNTEIIYKTEMSENDSYDSDRDDLQAEEEDRLSSASSCPPKPDPLENSERRTLLVDSICTSLKFHLNNENMSDDDLVKFHCDLLQYIHHYFKST